MSALHESQVLNQKSTQSIHEQDFFSLGQPYLCTQHESTSSISEPTVMSDLFQKILQMRKNHMLELNTQI
jgi:hypothetical protein